MRVKEIPCLALTDLELFKRVETEASELGYEGIFKQRKNNKEILVRFTSRFWNLTQQKYPTIKKEILAIIIVISNISY